MSRGGLLRLSALALLWGSNFLWIKIALRGFSPTQIVFIRMALGALVLVGFLLVQRGSLPRAPILWVHLAIAAVFANVAPYLLFAIGEQQVDSAVAGVLNGTTPLWTVGLAALAGVEARPGPLRLAGIGLGFMGTVVIFAPWDVRSQIMSWGGAACLLASASYGVSYAYMARFLAHRGLDALTLAASQVAAAAILSALLLPAGGLDAPRWVVDAFAAVTILGVLGTGMAYVLNYRLITDAGPTAASIVTYLLPVVAVILGFAVVHETPQFHVLAGMVIVLTGVALSQRRAAPT